MTPRDPDSRRPHRAVDDLVVIPPPEDATKNDALLQLIQQGSMLRVLGQQAPTVTVLAALFFILYQQVQELSSKVELLNAAKNDNWTQNDQEDWESDTFKPIMTKIESSGKETADAMKEMQIRLIRIEDKVQRIK